MHTQPSITRHVCFRFTDWNSVYFHSRSLSAVSNNEGGSVMITALWSGICHHLHHATTILNNQYYFNLHYLAISNLLLITQLTQPSIKKINLLIISLQNWVLQNLLAVNSPTLTYFEKLTSLIKREHLVHVCLPLFTGIPC